MIGVNRYAFSYNGASAIVRVRDHGLGEVVNLYSREARKGEARELMRVITGWADEHRWVLLLLAQAQRHPDNEMTNEQLMRFYEKHGFKRQTEYVREIRMIRHPSQEIHDL